MKGTEQSISSCHHCGKTATDTYHAKDGERGLCDACHDEHFGVLFHECADCSGFFSPELLRSCDGERLCKSCEESARELWWDDHPSGEPHFYEERRYSA